MFARISLYDAPGKALEKHHNGPGKERVNTEEITVSPQYIQHTPYKICEVSEKPRLLIINTASFSAHLYNRNRF